MFKYLLSLLLLCSIANAAQVRIKSVSSNYSATKYDDVILVDASGGARTVTLPAASAAIGSAITVKKTDSSTNAVVVSGGSIDGYGASYSIAVPYAAMQVSSDGSKYHVLPVLNSPGSVFSSDAGVMRMEFFRANDGSNCTTGTCNFVTKSAGISSITWVSTGNYAVNFAAGTFSAAPACIPTASRNAGVFCTHVSGSTTSFAGIQCYQSSTGANTNDAVSVICMGPR